MARSTRSRRTTTKAEDSETSNTATQDPQDSSEKKTRRNRKHESKDPEQKEEITQPKEKTPESDGQNTPSSSSQETMEKGRRGRKKRESEAESEHYSSTTKRGRSRRTQKEAAVVETAEGEAASDRPDQQEQTEDGGGGDGDGNDQHRVKEEQQQQHQPQQEAKHEQKAGGDAEEDSKNRRQNQPNEKEEEKQVKKNKDSVDVPSSKPLAAKSQKGLRMEVEEEKLDFEIEDELQLKVQNDEVLDGDDEDAKEEDDNSRTNERETARTGARYSGDNETSTKDSKDTVSSEKLNALDEMLKRRASRRNHWPAEKESGADKDKENLEAPRDRWGKLAEKTPSKEHAQSIVTTDSLKELSKELEAKVTKKDTADQKESSVNEETKGASVDEESKSGSVENARQPKETERVDDTKKSSDTELEDRRRARHISMNDIPGDSSSNGRESTKESGNQTGKAKLPSAGLALGSTNWTELEATRRKARDAATPPRLPAARHLLVLNLVRPFTLGQLTDLVTHAGARSISDLWLDRIKSKAIVEFADESASKEAREELHNIVWPKGSPKTIKCEFLSVEEVEKTKSGSVPSVQRETSQNSLDKDKSSKDSSKERTRIVVGPSDETRGNGDLRKTIEVHKDKVSEESRRRKASVEGEAQTVPTKKIREWDLPKLQQQQQQHKEGHEQRHQQNTEEPATAKRLEDLFRKTKATPNIYWIPLAEAAAVEKAKIRAEKQKEEDRRHRNRRLIN